MDSDKQSAKNGKGAPKRRISALQKVAGSMPAGSDVGSSLDDFIASANQTLTDTDAFKLQSDITGESQKKKEREKEESAAPPPPLEAQTAAEVARVAAEEAARKVLAEVTRKSAQHMAQLEAKLAEAEARASSAEKRVRAPRAPSPLPLVADEGADFAEGSFSQQFGFGGDMFRPRRHPALKAFIVFGAAVIVAAGVILAGNGRLWNKDEEPAAATSAPAAAKAPVVVAQEQDRPAAAQPAPLVTPAPAVTALPEPEKAATADKAVAEKKPEEPKAEEAPTTPAPAHAAPAAPSAPIVSALAPTAPTVTPLDGDEEKAAADKPAKKKKARAARSSRPVKKAESSKPTGSRKPSGGIVDPFAQ